VRSTPTVVEAARECALLARARAVAAFVGGGRPVTAKAVLRRTDSPAEAAGARHGRRSRVVSAQVSPRTLWGFDSLRDTSAQTVRSSGSAPVPSCEAPASYRGRAAAGPSGVGAGSHARRDVGHL